MLFKRKIVLLFQEFNVVWELALALAMTKLKIYFMPIGKVVCDLSTLRIIDIQSKVHIHILDQET